MSDNDSGDWITFGSGELTAAVNPFGAELSSLRDGQGRELMTDADPAYWTGRAPVLFPVIGVVNGGEVRFGGRTYPMAKHGFARRTRWQVAETGAAGATFALEDSAETRASYPFAFRLELAFAVQGRALTAEARLLNRSGEALPAQFGFHPAFTWPLPFGRARDEHRVVFDRDEPARLREIAPDGLIAAETRDSPLDGRVLRLRDELFAHDALVWDPVESRGATYGADGAPRLRVDWDAPRLGVWTKPGAAFVCVEPWNGIADPEGFTGEFRDKPGVFEVPAGGTWTTRVKVTLTD